MSDDDRKKQAAWGAAWLEVRIRNCMREAAMVAHIRERCGLRDGFVIAAGQIFDEVADELERVARERPEWPVEFTVAVAESASTVAMAGSASAGVEGSSSNREGMERKSESPPVDTAVLGTPK